MYEDATIQFNISLVYKSITGDVDVDKIFIFGSEDGVKYDFIGRAYFSGDLDIWNYYWSSLQT